MLIFLAVLIEIRRMNDRMDGDKEIGKFNYNTKDQF